MGIDFRADFDTHRWLTDVLRDRPGIAKNELLATCKGRFPYATAFATLEVMAQIQEVIIFKRGQRQHCLLVEPFKSRHMPEGAILALSRFSQLDAALTYTMSRARRPMAIGELVAAAGKPKSTINRHLQDMIEDGFWVTQGPCPGNPIQHNRNTCYELTPAAHALWEIPEFVAAFRPGMPA